MVDRYLMRDDTPIEPGTWAALDQAAIEAARNVLVGCRMLDIDGPLRLGLKAVALADMPMTPGTPVRSEVVPVHLVQRTFTLSKRDLAAFERDHLYLDTQEIVNQAREAALTEDSIIFNGTGNTAGIMSVPGTGTSPLSSWDQVGAAADDVIKAVTVLDTAGFHGPYSLALPPARYNLLLRRYPMGEMTELQHLQIIAAGGVFKAPVLRTSGVLLATGRQYISIVIGQDMTVGFIGPVAERLEFSITESLAPAIKFPAAICVLTD